MDEVILLKLGELVLKGLNRSRFEEMLKSGVKKSLGEKARLNSAQSTIYVYPETNINNAVKKLSKLFGVATLTKAAIASLDFENVKKRTSEYLDNELKTAKTFKVIGKRADKTYPLTSPEIGVLLGEYLLNEYPNLTVDLHNPELTVYVEVREGHVYIHTTPQKGAGGLPCGSGGKGLLMLSGGLDSPVAGYMMARRGMKIGAIHFESPPYTSERARQKVDKLAELLEDYCGRITLYVVHFTKIQEQIRKNCREELFTIIMRRFMFRIANKIAHNMGADAIITGESLGQVASQTAQAIACTDIIANIPVFRPLIGMDKQDIVDIAYKIETYETSIEPFEDCCTVFTPKHPKTKPRIEEIEKEEQKLDVEWLLAEVNIEKIN